MSINLDLIRENYKNFDDSKIEFIAKNESHQLHEEVLSILIEEIKKRNLDINLISDIDLTYQKLELDEFENLFNKIISCPCPICGNSDYLLIGSQIKEITSIIFFSFRKDYYYISCMKCADIKLKDANIVSFLTGWWSIFGLFLTPITLLQNYNSLNKREMKSIQVIELFIISFLKDVRKVTNEIEMFKLLKQNGIFRLVK